MAELKAYSKKVLDNELALLWVNTVGCLLLAFYCVHLRFEAAFPWLSAQVGLPWAAWAASKTGYTMKSTKENTAGGIVYEAAMQATKPQTLAETEPPLRDL